jgi:hypothetical protein
MGVISWNARHVKDGFFTVVPIIQSVISPPGKNRSKNLVQSVAVCWWLQTAIRQSAHSARKIFQGILDPGVLTKVALIPGYQVLYFQLITYYFLRKGYDSSA